MKKFLLIITIATGIFELSGMCKKSLTPSLNHIERRLVGREITRRGTNAIYNEISWQSRQEKPGPLIICDVFHQKSSQDDPLAQDIFDRIHHIEKYSGYITETQHITDSEGLITIQPTNHLGKYTRYYWAEDTDKTHLPIIAVYSHISDLNAVKEIIDEHDTSKE